MESKNENLTDTFTSKKFWDDKYEKFYHRTPKKILFQDLFEKIIPQGNGKKCLEIGCFPGHFLMYFTKNLNYIPYGLDYTDHLQKMNNFFKQNGVNNLTLFKDNFENFDPDEQFDLVCSFGFIEHFYDYQTVLKKHILLVKPGGYLIISCPNFTHFQVLLHRMVDIEELQKNHNFNAMDLDVWEEILEKNNMKILYHNYYRTMGFWSETNNVILRFFSLGLHYTLATIDFFINHPNKYLSPYMISISKKNQDE